MEIKSIGIKFVFMVRGHVNVTYEMLILASHRTNQALQFSHHSTGIVVYKIISLAYESERT